VAKAKPKTFDSLTLAAIRRATNGLATAQDWRKLHRAGAAACLSEGRWVVTLPAIDALAEWNRKHRQHSHTEYPADIGTADDGEVES